MTTVHLKQYPDTRPKTRGECGDMPRPCPFLSCRYHLGHRYLGKQVMMTKEEAEHAVALHGTVYAAAKALKVDRNVVRRALKREIDDNAVAEQVAAMKNSCALDVADAGAPSSAIIGKMIGVTRQSVDFVINSGTGKASSHDGAREMSDALASLDREPFDLLAHDGH